MKPVACISKPRSVHSWVARAILAMSFAVLTYAGAPTALAQGRGAGRVEPAPRQIIAGVPSSWPPQYGVDASGKPMGFAIDIMAEIATRAGVRVSYRVFNSFPETMSALSSGEIDLIPNTGIIPERLKYSSFTSPVETFVISVFVRDDTLDVRSLDDLVDRRVAVVEKNVGVRLLEHRPDIRSVIHRDVQTALFNLVAGQVDALVFPQSVILNLARKIGIEDRVKVVGAPLLEVKRGIQVRKDATELLVALNAAVEGFVGTPAYRAIYVKWYGRPEPYWTAVRAMSVTGALFLAALITMAWWRYRTVVRLNQGLEESIAERRQVEEALRDSKERFRDFAETASDWFWEMDDQLRFTYFSNRFERSGLGADKRIGKTRCQTTAGDTNQPKWRDHLADLAARKPFKNFEHTTWAQDGGLVHVSISGIPIFDEAGVFRGYRGTGTNITERKRVEQALGQSEQRFKEIANASADWFWERDENGRLTYISDRYQQLTGIDPKQVLGKTREESHDERNLSLDYDEDDRKRSSYYRERKPYRDIRVKRRLPDGRVRHWRASAWPVFDDKGGFRGYRGATTDITDEVRAEAKVAGAQRQFIAAIESVSDGFALFGADDRMVFCNSRFKAMNPDLAPKLVSGVTFEELLRDNIADKRILDALGDEEAFIRKRMAQHRNPTGPVVQQRRDGRWLELREERTPEGATFLVNTDITERKQAEEALRESEERFRTVVDHSPTKIHIKDLEGRYLLVNKVAERLFGVNDEEARGKTTLDIFSKEQAEAFGRHDGAVLEADRAIEEEEVWVRDDGVQTFLTVKFPIRGASGKAVAVGAIGTDITERKLAEKAVLKAKTEAELANRAKSEFLANMSHELRTPLNAIIGFSEILQNEILGPIGNPKYRDYATDISESGQHLLELINDILDLSKIESGTVELREENLDVLEVVRSSVLLLKERAQNGAVSLEQQLPAALPDLRADRRRFKQILVNLLSNAVKFTPPGGEVIIKAWQEPDGGHVLQVTDTGIGMAHHDVSRALAPFQQVDSQLSRKYEGSGLGLALTKSLVELHGGRLDLQSKVGFGTTVTVHFPAERLVSGASTAA